MTPLKPHEVVENRARQKSQELFYSLKAVIDALDSETRIQKSGMYSKSYKRKLLLDRRELDRSIHQARELIKSIGGANDQI